VNLYAARTAGAQQRVERLDPPGVDEAAYAASIANVADSAIHRLDFFPARAQLRVQMMFMSPSDSAVAVFYEVARRSNEAAYRVDDIASRFEATPVPDDLGALHADLVKALHAARSALDRLARSSAACQTNVTSIGRCQTPFTSASSAVAQAYKKYLTARAKIGDQIRDTHTVLPEFAVASGRPWSGGDRDGRLDLVPVAFRQEVP
jgi:hypothetical protein